MMTWNIIKNHGTLVKGRKETTFQCIPYQHDCDTDSCVTHFFISTPWGSNQSKIPLKYAWYKQLGGLGPKDLIIKPSSSVPDLMNK